VQTCGADGTWTPGTAWSCATGTCSGGACTGVTTTAPSCPAADGGASVCGPHGDSCCTSLEVPGGSFNRGYAVATPPSYLPTPPGEPADAGGFRLDEYLVTVGRFRPFAAAVAAGWTPPAGSGKHTHLNGGMGLAATDPSQTPPPGTTPPVSYETGWDAANDTQVTPTDAHLACNATYATWTSAPEAGETLPMNCVNWYEAYAFCIWDGGFLPSEAEWEYAAAGGNAQRTYPWGSTAPGTGNQCAIYGCEYPNATGTCTGIANVAPVGTATLGRLRRDGDLPGGRGGKLRQRRAVPLAPERRRGCRDVGVLLHRLSLRADAVGFATCATETPETRRLPPGRRGGGRRPRAPWS
jgi:sulfatase modifying factor 1